MSLQFAVHSSGILGGPEKASVFRMMLVYQSASEGGINDRDACSFVQQKSIKSQTTQNLPDT